ncbi:MAG: hypothetical protein AAGA77_11590 [Bacteroidota bacterium]
MKRLIVFLFVLGTLFLFQSCTQENNDDNPDNLAAPSIPNPALFTIPVQSFGVQSGKETSTTRNDKSNWIHAGLSVLVWNTVVFVHTAVPIAAFGNAFDYEAKYIGDLTWEWAYEYQAPPANGSITYDVTLTGTYIDNNDQVQWTMTVSEQGSGKDFVWYEGIVTVGHSEGTFTVNKDPENPQPYMEIAFQRNTSDNNVTIRFSNVLAGDEGQGDYIEWRTQNGQEFDRGYDVWNKQSLLQIEANEIQKDGRVKHPAHFGDENWHCWDTDQFNIDC